MTGRTQFGPITVYGNYAFNDAKYIEDTAFEGIRAGGVIRVGEQAYLRAP